MANQILDDYDPRAPSPYEREQARKLVDDYRMRQADARALWVYRVIMRAGWQEAFGYNDEPRLLARADALVAADPSILETVGERP